MQSLWERARDIHLAREQDRLEQDRETLQRRSTELVARLARVLSVTEDQIEHIDALAGEIHVDGFAFRIPAVDHGELVCVRFACPDCAMSYTEARLIKGIEDLVRCVAFHAPSCKALKAVPA